MKKLNIVFLIIFIASLNLFSQNWKPINMGNSYNFQIDTADFITNTIKVDSVNVVETDSIFFLNRIMTYCDTCQGENPNQFALRNQPQFLMRKMIKKTDSLFIFQDTSEFKILPLSKFGESWIFDVENNIHAVISFEGQNEIFGVLDSVKNISLSNGKIIIISKNFGILQFPTNSTYKYNLVGIEGNTQIGDHLPNFWDFFNYDVGDVFQREEYYWVYADYPSKTTYLRKYEIISKQILFDKIIYDIYGWIMTIYDDYTHPIPPRSAHRFSDNIIFIDSVNHFTNKINNELTDINKYREIPMWNRPLYDKVTIKKENNRYIKQCGSFDYFGYPFFQQSEIHPDLLVNEGSPDQVLFKYTEGLGLDYEMWFFEFGEGDIFMGKVHNEDTIGTVYSEEYFHQYSNINEISTQKLAIYPNPVKKGQILHINTDKEIVGYSIYNISGIKVQFGNLSNNEILINYLSSGIYILEINTENNIYRQKLMINN